MRIGVVGAGIFGLASAIELRGRGHTVTLVDQGKIPYLNASSTDVSKGIRRTWYGEKYVELVERSASKWREWEEYCGTSIYHQVGQLVITDQFQSGSPMYESVRYLRECGAKIEVLSARQARTRFPQFVIRDGEECIYDSWGGYLESGRAVSCLARLAQEKDVQLLEDSPVDHVEDLPGAVRVTIRDGSAVFDRVIVSAGVWVGRLLPEVGRHIQVTHQEMVLIEVEGRELFGHGRMPVWSIDPDKGGWYGFPLLREGYLKVSLDALGETVDPDLDREGTPEFVQHTMEFLRERIPEMAKGTLVGSRSCLYGNTPDDHFIIDWVPGSSKILVAGGGSGHGFKFGGAIGEVIADAVEEKANSLGSLFRIGNRFGSEVQLLGRDRTRGSALAGTRISD